MKTFEASPALCDYAITTLKDVFKQASGENIPETDEQLREQMQSHIAEILDTVIVNYCRYLQYDGEHQTTLFDADGFASGFSAPLMEHLIYVKEEDDTAFLGQLKSELIEYMSTKENPIKSGRWGSVHFENGTLTAHILPHRKRSFDDLFGPN